MTRKTLIDKSELDRRTEEYVNQWRHVKPLYIKEKATWTEDEKHEWKNARSAVYCRMREENKERMKNFWLQMLGDNALKEFFKRYGLSVWCGRVHFFDGGSIILTKYLNDVVLPAFEKEVNIKGVKLKHKRTSGLTQDIFNWEKAEVLNSEVSENSN